jgi:plastocyanin
MPSLTKAILVAGLALQANAKTIRINAGQGGLVYNPNSVTADMGDVVEFHFFPKNHSVVAGDFQNPCHPAPTGGFFSGFFPTANGTENVRARDE